MHGETLKKIIPAIANISKYSPELHLVGLIYIIEL